jgi:hypothetical protein
MISAAHAPVVQHDGAVASRASGATAGTIIPVVVPAPNSRASAASCPTHAPETPATAGDV